MHPLLSQDFGIAEHARDVLSHHPHFVGRADSFKFEFAEDRLIVSGQVPTFYLKQLLQAALKGFGEIGRIDNRVVVIASDGVSST